jgi:hypothetical protein
MLFHTLVITSEGLLIPNILDPVAILEKQRSHLKSLRILLRATTEYVNLEVVDLCYASVAKGSNKISRISMSYFPICGRWIEGHAYHRGIGVLKICLPR